MKEGAWKPGDGGRTDTCPGGVDTVQALSR